MTVPLVDTSCSYHNHLRLLALPVSRFRHEVTTGHYYKRASRVQVTEAIPIKYISTDKTTSSLSALRTESDFQRKHGRCEYLDYFALTVKTTASTTLSTESLTPSIKYSRSSRSPANSVLSTAFLQPSAGWPCFHETSRAPSLPVSLFYRRNPVRTGDCHSASIPHK